MSDSREPPKSSAFIDLHSHTTASDGTLTPAELVALAHHTGLSALGITDHDTFAGYQEARPLAKDVGLELVCGIELNTRFFPGAGREHIAAHVLAYFPTGEPSPLFIDWLVTERENRRERNRKLAQTLHDKGLDVTLEEVEARGKILTGRPHFARVLFEKGYVSSIEEAFGRYLGESAPTYVERESVTTEEAIRIIRAGFGVPVVAHPIRLSLSRDVERVVLIRLKEAGLLGLEVYHSEHPPERQAYYRQLAQELDLLPTGGSDFHGAVKPAVELGTGIEGNVRVPLDFLDQIRNLALTVQ